MSSPNLNARTQATPPARAKRWKLWLVIGLCIAPIAASYLAYYVWQPEGHVNYGELLEPRVMPQGMLRAIDGTPFQFADVRRDWVLLVADSGRCDERCRTKLTYIRQVRLAQGRETERVERVWLLTDDATPPGALLAEHPGLRVVRASGTAALQMLPARTSAAEHIYVVDPLGHLMMRYPENPDPRRILKDVSRLLRHSKWK